MQETNLWFRRTFLAVSATTALAGCSSDTASDDPESTGSPSGNDDAKTTTGSDTDDSESRNSANAVLGEVVKDDSLAMVARSVEKSEQLDEFSEAQSGNTFIVVRLAVKNTSSEFIDFNSFWQTRLKDSENHVYDASFSSTDHPIESGLLAPGEIARGDVVFEAPSGAENLTMQFDFSAFELFDYERVTIDLGSEADSIGDLEQSLNANIKSPGKSVTHDGITVTVHDVRTETSLGEFTSAEDGHEYVIPDFSITNETGEPLTVSTLLQMQLKTGTGLSYGSNINATSSLSQSYSEGSDIADGETRRGELAYQVETDSSPIYWAFNFMSLSEPKKAFWELR
ncbi:DUF4352 domain-containing protein [Haladaptatus cibarius]|uniref:DUF4352 domain-containing protein n=1 Tax=Haladaptatus cibarius TaxID=453847 RepID=UPI000678B74F|nr:DUF4352 domain-containing protein [Haladaptatus cibarius]